MSRPKTGIKRESVKIESRLLARVRKLARQWRRTLAEEIEICIESGLEEQSRLRTMD